MTTDELLEILNKIQTMKCETQTLELKSAQKGCPKRLYDSLSSFSNQDDGGTIIFGVDEKNGYEEVGVYDAQDIQKKINEQCLQMEPAIRALLTVVEKDGKMFVSAEIPGMDVTSRPCYYKGSGRLKGSYVRVGDSDEPMTEYEVYSYEALRKKYEDDIRIIPRVNFSSLSEEKLDEYLWRLKKDKPNLSKLSDEDIFNLMSIKRNEGISLSATLLFCPYPQAYMPQLSIVAIAVAGKEVGEERIPGERFIDNQRIEGTIPEMLDEALNFVRRNMKNTTYINPETGQRQDRTQYPVTAVREAILNALVHRDYSIHTEGMPIRIEIYEDRMEIHNPGGLYGRMKVEQLGKIQPDTRNPVLATALETLKITENRYSGIPTIRNECKRFNIPDPVFINERGEFVVVFYNENKTNEKGDDELSDTEKIIEFCKTPRSRNDIAGFLGLSSKTYAVQRYVNPLVEKGLINLSLPDTPGSSKQKYYS